MNMMNMIIFLILPKWIFVALHGGFNLLHVVICFFDYLDLPARLMAD